MKNMKRFLKSTVCCVLSFASSLGFGVVNAKNLTFVLDPGHGGVHPGCVYSYDGKTILEKDLNLKIAKYLKQELEKYKTQKGEKIKVCLTRNDDSTGPDLEGRVVFAKNKRAKALISLHNNACGYPENNKNGCMVLVTHSNYRNLYKKEHDLAKSIIKELNGIGIKTAKIANATGKNVGLLRRLSDDGSTYENGETTDWYGIIRHGINHNILSILVEHAYLSNEKDYRKFLSTDEKLKKLAIADARGIAKYYKLKLESNNRQKTTTSKNKKSPAKTTRNKTKNIPASGKTKKEDKITKNKEIPEKEKKNDKTTAQSADEK